MCVVLQFSLLGVRDAPGVDFYIFVESQLYTTRKDANLIMQFHMLCYLQPDVHYIFMEVNADLFQNSSH